MTVLLDKKAGARVNAAGVAQETPTLPCTDDLYRLLAMLAQVTAMARDERHHRCVAWPDLRDYLDELSLENKAALTLVGYERQLRLLLLDHPDAAFADFDKQMVMESLTKVPAQSRYITKSVYNGFFSWGVREDRLDRNPVDKIRKLRPGPSRPSNVFTEAEVLTLEAGPDGALWALLFRLGLRRADALRLQRMHLDLDGMRATILNGKGGKHAVIPFGPDLAMRIADLDLLERLEPDDHLWYRPSQRRDRRRAIGHSTFQRWYGDQLRAAGIEYRNPHQTRHTFHWLLRHVEHLDLEERQLLMRHASPTTTVKQYGVVDLEDVARKRQLVAV